MIHSQENKGFLPNSVVYVEFHNINTGEKMADFEYLQNSAITHQVLFQENKKLLQQITSHTPRPNEMSFFRSSSMEHEWVYQRLDQNTVILVLYYTVLGSKWIRELIEEYARIFEEPNTFETGLELFKQFNYQNRKSKGFYISRWVQIPEELRTDDESKVSMVTPRIEELDQKLDDDNKSLFRQNLLEEDKEGKQSIFRLVIKLIFFMFLVTLFVYGVFNFNKQRILAGKSRNLHLTGYGEGFHEYLSRSSN